MIGPVLFVVQWWRQIALVVMLAGVIGYHWNAVREARKQGMAECVSMASADVDRRIKDALENERRVTGGDASGGVRHDKWKRPD